MAQTNTIFAKDIQLWRSDAAALYALCFRFCRFIVTANVICIEFELFWEMCRRMDGGKEHDMRYGTAAIGAAVK